MRVLHIISSLGAGGAEQSLAEMLPMFSESGVESALVCLSRAHEGVHDRVVSSGYGVRVVGTARATALPRIRRAIKDFRPDVVHTTISEANMLGRIAAAGLPCRVMSSLVNTTYDGVRMADPGINRHKLAAAKAVDRFTARHMTDHFHAISEAVRDSAVTHLGISPDRVTVVERGRDLARLGEPSAARRRAARDALGLPEEAEVVLNIGRQDYQKDHATLLEAVAKLAPRRPRLVLLQAGRDGKATPEVRRLASEMSLGDRVRLLGFRSDVGDLLAAADVFAFPSIYEGLGGSVLEAMAMRVPIVVTAVPALEEVVESGRGARVVPVGDASALAEAIDGLLEDRAAAAETAMRARQIFMERFTLQRSAERMVGLYRRVAAGE